LFFEKLFHRIHTTFLGLFMIVFCSYFAVATFMVVFKQNVILWSCLFVLSHCWVYYSNSQGLLLVEDSQLLFWLL